MKVYVSFWGSLDVAIRENEIDIEDGTTIAQLLDHLITSYPELKSKINFELVLINSVYTSIEKNLKNGDKVIIIPPITNWKSLQSAFDPDASKGHKGSGYSVHITEACNNADKNEIITDYEVHGAARSDIGKSPEIVHRLESGGLKPEKLFADGGYPSVPSALKVIKRNIVDNDADRENFVTRMGSIALETGTSIYAWALISKSL